MDEDQLIEMAQRAVKAYIFDLARNGPADIFDFTDEVMKKANCDMTRCTEVDKLAIRIIQQIARDLLKP